MLKTRIITALGLLSILLPALFFASQMVWMLLVTLIVSASAWEWGRLLRADSKSQWLFVFGTCTLCAAFLLWVPAINQTVYGLAVFFWCGVIPLWLRYKWPLSPTFSGWLVGLLVLLPAWFAMGDLRAQSPLTLLAVLAIAWVADVAAYAAGRLFGKHKLAINISPGKTWEGAVGAWLGVTLYGFLVIWFADKSVSLFHAVLALLVLTALSIIGDLFESLLKRQAGLKDSSQLLPGHGGVLDRVDSLTSVLPVAAAMLIVLG